MCTLSDLPQGWLNDTLLAQCPFPHVQYLSGKQKEGTSQSQRTRYGCLMVL